MDTQQILDSLGLDDVNPGGFAGEWMASGELLDIPTPVDGSHIASVRQVTEAEYDRIVERAHEAFLKWRTVPAPRRGEIVRQLGNRLREKKEALGALVTLEMGKIRAEGEGEVQEMIDICD
ncbi:MAG: aldehyde dehydrogenase family protein, partial [Longimicrobiales bacterium]